jgi:hypothetical protein
VIAFVPMMVKRTCIQYVIQSDGFSQIVVIRRRVFTIMGTKAITMKRFTDQDICEACGGGKKYPSPRSGGKESSRRRKGRIGIPASPERGDGYFFPPPQASQMSCDLAEPIALDDVLDTSALHHHGHESDHNEEIYGSRHLRSVFTIKGFTRY